MSADPEDKAQQSTSNGKGPQKDRHILTSEQRATTRSDLPIEHRWIWDVAYEKGLFSGIREGVDATIEQYEKCYGLDDSREWMMVQAFEQLRRGRLAGYDSDELEMKSEYDSSIDDSETSDLCDDLQMLAMAESPIEPTTVAHYPPLPVEILQQIFDRTFPPHYLLDWEHAFGEHAFACMAIAHQKSLMSVCQSWYNVVKPYLYEQIHIRRPTQLFMLLDSLKRNPENQPLVKGISVSCVVGAAWAEKFFKTIQSVVDRAPNLTDFSMKGWSVTGDPDIPDAFRFPVFKQDNMRLGISYFTTLDSRLNHTQPQDFPHGGFDRLTRLSLNVDYDKYFTDSQNQALDLDLPVLETLDLHHYLEFTGLRGTWKMPRLKNFSIDWSDPHALIGFLHDHGRGLRRLELAFTLALELNLHLLCPSLEHLVVRQGSPSNVPLAHPTIRWIDVWLRYSSFPTSEQYLRLRALQHANARESLPSFLGLRFFHSQLLHLPDLPHRLPPWSVTSARDSYEIRFADFFIRHEEGRVFGTAAVPENESPGGQDATWKYASSSGYYESSEGSSSEAWSSEPESDGGKEFFSGFDSE
ncbi:hypothetical protein CC1G_04508 [Coprinopsis cinerea okayama7|uniref:Uncharacterized protein n=1 Tax=Coprinopsis cinerea (strain Okayama-7 / 130 / ATCC MYA-4618 / FGSC 9003) TaxID=240176 RepID=A8N5D0_COPC7|nr:hypothetical protein CC1G_04508 [Coprinopsis cinerea okayama7\|eukprot:XP_001830075.1 hypothetical protein CC1G_04508 [Coprinopsis cinerea okayama7\